MTLKQLQRGALNSYMQADVLASGGSGPAASLYLRLQELLGKLLTAGPLSRFAWLTAQS